MPRGDRTGPMGAGPMSGRGAGWCTGFDRPGFANAGPRPGMGQGRRGGGRGWRNMYYATGMPGWVRPGLTPPAPAAGQPLADMKAQAAWLDGCLEELKKRIEAIEGQSL